MENVYPFAGLGSLIIFFAAPARSGSYFFPTTYVKLLEIKKNVYIAYITGAGTGATYFLRLWLLFSFLQQGWGAVKFFSGFGYSSGS